MGNLPDVLLQHRRHPQSVSAKHRSEWPELGRRLSAKYASGLFPGVASDVASDVWRFFSSLSYEYSRGRPPSPRHILKLARAGAQSAGWDRNAMAQLEKTREQMRTCARLHPAWVAAWLSIEIPVRLRNLLAHSG